MRAMQGAGLAREEMLFQVSGVPKVQIAHLRSFCASDAKEPARWHSDTPRITWRHQNFADLLRPRAAHADPGKAELWQGVDRITDRRPDHAACLGVLRGRGCRVLQLHGSGLSSCLPIGIREARQRKGPCVPFPLQNGAFAVIDPF
jgi:hypothetical protein